MADKEKDERSQPEDVELVTSGNHTNPQLNAKSVAEREAEAPFPLDINDPVQGNLTYAEQQALKNGN